MDAKEQIQITSYIDARGKLSVIEGARDIPFDVKRVFFISDVPANAVRGEHAYKHNEFAVCTSGSCKIRITDGKTETLHTLRSADAGVLIPAYTWRTLYDFSADCVLTVLSDAYFSPKDYIFDAEAFFGTEK